ncbi:ChaN family lipoprotein [Candidatus Pacearchaeota archaeon]|nr:ChaN family lipoprotein [Candidatus Pacearchaeota archaeon]
MSNTIDNLFGTEEFDDSNSNYDEVLSYLQRTNPKDADYAPLFRLAPLILFGEYHGSEAAKKEVIQNMSKFWGLGITHFATEMLSLSMQPAIDRYCSVGDNPDEIKAYHQKEFSRLGENFPDLYLGMIDAAKSAGMKVIALDLDNVEETPEVRNKAWARLLARIQTNQSSKILVYCGAGHIGHSQYCSKFQDELKNNHGILSQSISIIGEHDHPVCRIVPRYSNPDILLKASEDLGLQDRRFVIPLKQTPSRSAEVYLHLPAV